MLCTQLLIDRATPISDNEIIFPASVFVLRLLSLEFLEQVIIQKGKPVMLPHKFRRKWTNLEFWEEMVVKSLQLVFYYPSPVTKVTFKEQFNNMEKEVTKYFTKFNRTLLPTDKPLWLQLLNNSCFINVGCIFYWDSSKKQFRW